MKRKQKRTGKTRLLILKRIEKKTRSAQKRKIRKIKKN